MSEPTTIEPVTRSGSYVSCGLIRWWLIGPGATQMFPASATDFSPRPKMTVEERNRVGGVLRWLNARFVNKLEVTDDQIKKMLSPITE